jgi:hypothetical protein
MKAYGGVDVYTHVFLTSALIGDKWSASRPCRFTSGERAPGTHWIGGWMGPQRAVWTLRRTENSWPYRDSNCDPSVVHPVVSRYTDCAIRVLVVHTILSYFLRSILILSRILVRGEYSFHIWPPLPPEIEHAVRTGRFEEEEHFVTSSGTEPRLPCRPTRTLVVIVTELTRLLVKLVDHVFRDIFFNLWQVVSCTKFCQRKTSVINKQERYNLAQFTGHGSRSFIESHELLITAALCSVECSFLVAAENRN